jgi:endonuclease IV
MLGIHISKIEEGKKTLPLDESVAIMMKRLNINSCQIFTHGPRSLNECKFDINSFVKKTTNVYVANHSPYIMVGIWNALTSPFHKKEFYLSAFTQMIKRTHEVGSDCFVLHITKSSINKIKLVVHQLKPILIKYKVKLGLEMVALKSCATTYETPEKINALIDAIGPDDYYGIVVDTAHIWAAGFDCSTYKQMAKWLSGIKNKSKIILFHLNGSQCNIGSGKDKHALVFDSDDIIWNNISYEESGVRAIVEFSLKHHIPMICEVHGESPNIKKTLKKIKKEINKCDSK